MGPWDYKKHGYRNLPLTSTCPECDRDEMESLRTQFQESQERVRELERVIESNKVNWRSMEDSYNTAVRLRSEAEARATREESNAVHWEKMYDQQAAKIMVRDREILGLRPVVAAARTHWIVQDGTCGCEVCETIDAHVKLNNERQEQK